MNWTGGRLQQSRRTKGGLSAQQKAYFAKARARLLNDEAPRPPLDFPFCNGGNAGQSVKPSQLHVSANENTESPRSTAQKIGASSVLRDSILNKCSTRQIEAQSPGPEDLSAYSPYSQTIQHESKPRTKWRGHQDIHIAPAKKKMKHTHYARDEGPNKSNPCNENKVIEQKRQQLLRRTDWLGSVAVRPLRITFPSQQDRKRTARRRKLDADDLARLKQQCRNKLTKGRAHTLSSPSRNRQQVETISVRHGTQIHGSQMTRTSMPQFEFCSSAHAFVTPEEMLMDSSPASAYNRTSHARDFQGMDRRCSPYAPAHCNTQIIRQRQYCGDFEEQPGTCASPATEPSAFSYQASESPRLGSLQALSDMPQQAHIELTQNAEQWFEASHPQLTPERVRFRTREGISPTMVISWPTNESPNRCTTSSTAPAHEVLQCSARTGRGSTIANTTDSIEESQGYSHLREKGSVGAEEAPKSSIMVDAAYVIEENQSSPVASIVHSPADVEEERRYTLVGNADFDGRTINMVKHSYTFRPAGDAEKAPPENHAAYTAEQESGDSPLRAARVETVSGSQSFEEQDKVWRAFVLGDDAVRRSAAVHGMQFETATVRPQAPPEPGCTLPPRDRASSSARSFSSIAVQVSCSPVETPLRSLPIDPESLPPRSPIKTLATEPQARSSSTDPLALWPKDESDESIKSNKATNGNHTEKDSFEFIDGADDRSWLVAEKGSTLRAGKKGTEHGKVIFTKPARYGGEREQDEVDALRIGKGFNNATRRKRTKASGDAEQASVALNARYMTTHKYAQHDDDDIED
ncbi:MAG: hypothetical protein LQ340_006329 [Diploschistes diacapsis]|nr:MAG: hypothetical protein LQ340_006329 [Diploschistes diacapsis]